MQPTNVSNYHVEYMNVASQYWHPSSARFAGGDNLVTALYNGWEVDSKVRVKAYSYAGMRYINVYQFNLVRDGEKMMMPVIYTPYIERLIEKSGLEVVRVEEQAATF